MNNIEFPYLKSTAFENTEFNSKCTDSCKHVLDCSFCSKFLKNNTTKNILSDNNNLFFIVIGFLIIFILILLFKK